MRADPGIYARLALDQIPRLLGNLDRNPASPTYGCFHRDYWLDKTSDFPDAVRQFAVHALAIVYRYPFEGNIYAANPKVRDWTIAALRYWASLQHGDGSFDEFYPFERGWVGPTAFTTYAATEAYRLVEHEVSPEACRELRATIGKSARFIMAGESEEDALANHHAMACLSVWKAFELLDEPDLAMGFERLWRGFLSYHIADEGWSREYDGIDPGYLSATVSFLAKVNETRKDPEITEVLARSVETCSYFAYPDGFYAGSIGSRNTLHFYPHGFELLSREVPMAASVAEWMLASLGRGKLVPPGIMSDRYVVYRVPEFLLAFLDHRERTQDRPALPWQRDSFTRLFPVAGICAANRPGYYAIANLAKGGVIKVFKRSTGDCVLSDGGILGRLDTGQVVTSQWIDPEYVRTVEESRYRISGQLHNVPSHHTFTPLKNVLFRIFLLTIGRIPAVSHWLKGKIRRTLILGASRTGVGFCRRIEFCDHTITVEDEIRVKRGESFRSLMVGDEFVVRHVPQSRYFQAYELGVTGHTVGKDVLERWGGMLRLTRHIDVEKSERSTMDVVVEP